MAHRDFRAKKLLTCHPNEGIIVKLIFEWIGVILLGILLGTMFAWGF